MKKNLWLQTYDATKWIERRVKSLGTNWWVKSEDQLTFIQQTNSLPGNNTIEIMFRICTTSKSVTSLAKEKNWGNAFKNSFLLIQNVLKAGNGGPKRLQWWSNLQVCQKELKRHPVSNCACCCVTEKWLRKIWQYDLIRDIIDNDYRFLRRVPSFELATTVLPQSITVDLTTSDDSLYDPPNM